MKIRIVIKISKSKIIKFKVIAVSKVPKKSSKNKKIKKGDLIKMISIHEEKKNNSSYYVIEFKNDSGKVERFIDVVYKVYIRTYKNKTYYLMYDDHANLIQDAYKYLNNHISSQSQNSKKKSLYALKTLYSFSAIISKEFKNFENADFDNLVLFLKGRERVGGNIEYHNLTRRGKTTVNGYLTIYRDYFDFLSISKDSILYRTMNRSMRYIDVYENVHKIKQFRLNEKVPSKQVEVPDYISLDQYKKIMKYIKETKTDRDEIIVRLMYENGLRIGEVLGLTREDVALEEDVNGNQIPVLYLRNRLTDKAFQNAKSCMKVHSKQTYRSKDYNTEWIGYHKIQLSYSLYEKISDYIEKSHVKYQKSSYDTYKKESEKYRETYERYQKKTIADSVIEKNIDNFYIFLNSTQTPLSTDIWRKVIVDIFEHNEIKVDKGVKEHNLNHRFRHGFAMLNVQYFHKNEFELKVLLRHKNITSVSCYFKPTMEDQIKILNDSSKTLYGFLENEIYKPIKEKIEAEKKAKELANNEADAKEEKEVRPQKRNRFSADF